jgi:hypothetical protein
MPGMNDRLRSFACGGVEVPGLGRVSITGTVIVDRVEFPA